VKTTPLKTQTVLLTLAFGVLCSFAQGQTPAATPDPVSEIPTYGAPVAAPQIAAPEITPEKSESPAPTSTAKALEPPPPKKSSYRTDTLLGISYLAWNEKMHLQQNATTADDDANFVGTTFNVERNMAYARWGWTYGGTLGTGKASGGSGGAVINFQKGNQSWLLYGAYAKLYQKWSGRLYVGFTVPVFIRQIDWPSDQNGVFATSGKPVNLSLLLELNLRLNQKWDLYQSIGPFGEAGSTLWRLGVSYRL
jgi:hypothetical protein